MEEMFKVGVVTSSHGIRGEVKVFPTTDDVKRFKKLKEVILDTGKEQLNLKVEGVKFFKNMAILKFEGVDSPEAVAKFRQKDLYVLRKDAVRLQRDEYFIADLIGLSVLDDENNKIGTVTDVITTGANDVYVVKMENEEKELLLPAIKQCILNIDIEAGNMVVHIMEGLMDL